LTGWLPEPLRLANLDDASMLDATADQDCVDEALPAFLADDDEEEDLAEAEDDEQVVIAAE
jgi:ParB family chromosome partitioning protein